MGVQNGKFYDAEATNKFFGDVESAFESYQKAADYQIQAHYGFITTEDFRGEEATTAKIKMRGYEVTLLEDILDLQADIGKLQETLTSAFSKSVDSAVDAIIDYDTVEKINNSFKGFYYTYNLNAKAADSRLLSVKSKYEKYGPIPMRNFSYANHQYRELCGADCDDAGFLYSCMMKLVTYDTNAKTIIKEYNILNRLTTMMDKMENSKAKFLEAKAAAKAEDAAAEENSWQNKLENIAKWGQGYLEKGLSGDWSWDRVILEMGGDGLAEVGEYIFGGIKNGINGAVDEIPDEWFTISMANPLNPIGLTVLEASYVSSMIQGDFSFEGMNQHAVENYRRFTRGAINGTVDLVGDLFSVPKLLVDVQFMPEDLGKHIWKTAQESNWEFDKFQESIEQDLQSVYQSVVDTKNAVSDYVSNMSEGDWYEGIGYMVPFVASLFIGSGEASGAGKTGELGKSGEALKELEKINDLEKLKDAEKIAKEAEAAEKAASTAEKIEDVEKIFNQKAIDHLKKVDGFNKKHGGIKGAHTLESFEEFSKAERPVSIVSKTEVSEGIYELEYKVAKMERGVPVVDAEGNIEYVNKIYKKTVVDTAELTTDEVVKMAKEAFSGREVYTTPGGQKYINGISNDGVKYEGWISEETGELESFYPVKEFQHNY